VTDGMQVDVATRLGVGMMTPEELIDKIKEMGGYSAGGGTGSPGDPGPDGEPDGGGWAPVGKCEQWCSEVFCEEYCDENGCITICRVYTWCCQPSV
jgi:hypothetical protein